MNKCNEFTFIIYEKNYISNVTFFKYLASIYRYISNSFRGIKVIQKFFDTFILKIYRKQLIFFINFFLFMESNLIKHQFVLKFRIRERITKMKLKNDF